MNKPGVGAIRFFCGLELGLQKGSPQGACPERSRRAKRNAGSPYALSSRITLRFIRATLADAQTVMVPTLRRGNPRA